MARDEGMASRSYWLRLNSAARQLTPRTIDPLPFDRMSAVSCSSLTVGAHSFPPRRAKLFLPAVSFARGRRSVERHTSRPRGSRDWWPGRHRANPANNAVWVQVWVHNTNQDKKGLFTEAFDMIWRRGRDCRSVRINSIKSVTYCKPDDAVCTSLVSRSRRDFDPSKTTKRERLGPMI